MTIYSMTGFAHTKLSGDWGELVCEMKAVNHRFFECKVRLPDGFSELEHTLKKMLNQHVNRGKIDISVRYQPSDRAKAEACVNYPLIQALIDAHGHMTETLGNKARGQIDPLALLRWPGAVDINLEDLEPVKEAVITCHKQCIEQLQTARLTEGQALSDTIKQRLDAMNTFIAIVEEEQDGHVKKSQEKLNQRIAQLISEPIDPQRLASEVAILAQKADIAEEIDRLKTHIRDVSQCLEKGGTVGRRLDFLMQELQREANTIASKSVSERTTRAAVELKVLIEQMREQIQNIE